MNKFCLVCPSIKSYTSFSCDKYISDRRFYYKKYLDMLVGLGFEIEYLAEDQVAGYIIKDLDIRNTKCVTALPEIDESCYYKYFSDDKDILPADVNTLWSERISFPEGVKVKYPKVTEFKDKNEYLKARRASLIESIRLHSNQYKQKCTRLIEFRSTVNFSSNLEEMDSVQGNGRLSMLIDMKDSYTIFTYGGVRVDVGTINEILKMEALSDGR